MMYKECAYRGFTLYLRWIKALIKKGEGDEGGKNMLDTACLQNNSVQRKKMPHLFLKDAISFKKTYYIFF